MPVGGHEQGDSVRARQPQRALGTLVCLALLPTAWSSAAVAAPPAPASDTAQQPKPFYLDPSHPFAERAADLVSRMTLPEKVAQLHTNSAPAIPRLGVQ